MTDWREAPPAVERYRKEAFGEGWTERFVDAERASVSDSVGSAISESLSYVVLSHFASLEECGVLKDAALELQQIFLSNGNANDQVFQGIEPKWVSEVSRFSVTALLNQQANAMSNVLIQRLLTMLEFGDAQLSELSQKVFGYQADLNQMTAKFYDEMSYDKVSNPEPMVNIYEEGGFFKRHEDGQPLTLLVILDDATEGGGTAFYSSTEEEETTAKDNTMSANNIHGNNTSFTRKMPPQRVERPPAGTAMIWGKDLNHAALPVITGRRAVYVGSFGLVTREK